MRSLRVLLLLSAAVACALHSTSTDAAHAHVRTHHHHHRDHHSRDAKQLFRVQTRKSLFERAAQRVALDVWSVRVADSNGDHDDPLVDVKAYATPAAMKSLQRAGGGSAHHTRIHVSQRGRSKTVTVDNSTESASDWMLDIVEEEKDMAVRIAKDRADVAACLNRTTGFLEKLKQATTPYTQSAFFDCFRPYDQVFAFLDTMMAQNSGIMTKLPNVSTTIEGHAIPAYRLSTTATGAAVRTKKTIYVQALIHAREWQAGSSTFYTIAHMVDELRRGTSHAKSLFDEFDWYFVPIVNIDGYIYSATGDRYWRTNRRLLDSKGNSIAGVDLNRNFGPDKFFNLEPEIVDEETYPGEKPLSEPSTAGIFRFVTSLENLVGVVDMHTFGGEVLRPFSNQPGEAPAPFGPQLKKLTESVTETLSKHAEQPYMSKTGGDLYKAYGCFDDGMLLAFNYTVPSITIEVEGDDFIVPQSSIRRVGNNIYHGLLRFAKEASSYQKMVDSLDSSDSSDD